MPPGFTATPFATGLVNPRRILVLPNGDILVAEQSAGYLTLLRDDGSGHAEWIDRHVEDLNRPYGLAWRGDHVLIADQDGIWSVPHIVGALRAGRSETQRVDQVPPEERKPIAGAYGARMITKKGVFGIVQGHQNRPLAIDPKTGALFVGVGSSGNLGVEPEPKATIQRFDADGSNQATFASGMRNPTALAFHPQTGELYALVQERDGLGDKLPSDYLTRVQEGGFYGWPYAYIGKHPQAGFANRAPDKVNATMTPDLLFEAHSSALDLVFYEGEQFPPEYKGHAFVALKGSWNSSQPTGYKVVRVPFKNGRPEGYYENFVTGFWLSGEAARGSLGTARCARGNQRWRAVNCRRYRRHDLAYRLHRQARWCWREIARRAFTPSKQSDFDRLDVPEHRLRRAICIAVLQRRDDAGVLCAIIAPPVFRERLAFELDPGVAAANDLQDVVDAGQEFVAGCGE